MAPVPAEDDNSIADLSVSSLELDLRSPEPVPTNFALHIRSETSTLPSIEQNDVPLTLHKRDGDSGFKPGQGTRPPESFNNNGFLALFAIIGAAMVIASLWFFFWAKNGGFQFNEGDWDDYKSTVMRRKGPDGKTLSNATKSTKLGGGSIAGTQHYKWAKSEARSVIGYDEKGRKGIRAERGWGKTHSVWSGDTSYQNETFGTQTISDMTEIRSEPAHHHHVHRSSNKHDHSKRYRDRDVADYKRERPARVGGLNRVADGSQMDTSVEGSVASSAEPILNHASAPGRSSPAKDKEKERAERKARDDAARMERRWKKEAEEAAAALARENARSVHPPPTAKKSATPSASRPSPTKPRARSSSRSQSPKKRDFSYQRGAADAATEVLSTAYTATNSNSRSDGSRTASYYNSYRPQAEESQGSGRGYSSEYGKSRRQSSPKKGGRSGGYRRGADSDLD